MSSRKQKLLTRVNWYRQSSLEYITEYITDNKFYDNIEVVVTCEPHDTCLGGGMAQARRRLLSELVINPFRDTNMRHKASVCQQPYTFSSFKNLINSLQMKDNYMK